MSASRVWILVFLWGLASMAGRMVGYTKDPGPPPFPAYPSPWAPSPFEHFLFSPPYGGRSSEIPWPEGRFGLPLPSGTIHLGVDIPAPEHTPILAIGDGLVAWAGEGFQCGRPCRHDPYGLAVLLRHDLGWNGFIFYSLYAHMGQIWVHLGQRVRQGTPLGTVGTTGHTTGPHVHLEIRARRVHRGRTESYTLNPELWLAPYVGWGALVGRVENRWNWPLLSARVYIVPETWPEQARRLWWGYHTLRLRTYPWASTAHSDPLYMENFAVNNLPAGRYRVIIEHRGSRRGTTLTIWPGRVTYFHYQGSLGFVEIQEPLQHWPDAPRWAYLP